MQQNVANPSIPNLTRYPLTSSTNRPTPPLHSFQFQKQSNYQFVPSHRPQQSRIMYKSTIQPTVTPSQSQMGFGPSRLETMGRLIKQQFDQPPKTIQNLTVFQLQPPKPLVFRSDRPERAKMASSVIFFNKNNEQNGQFPSFTTTNNAPPKGLQSLMGRARNVQEEIYVIQTPEEKKQKEIFQIRQQVESLNKKMENNSKFKSNVGLNQDYSAKQQYNRDMVTKKVNIEYSQTQPQKNRNSIEQKYEISLSRTSTNCSLQQTNTVTQKQQKHDLFSKKDSQTQSTSNSSFRDLAVEPQGMFKKKHPYTTSIQNGKTNQSLLKMLGITLKNSTPQHPQVKKSYENTFIPASKTMTKLDQQITTFPKYVSPSTPQKYNIPQVQPPKKFTKEDFKIGKKMGKGQFGEVMLVQHKLTGFLCGMKVMSKKQIRQQKYSNQIARELSIQFYLAHRNIAPLYGYFQDADNIYLLVEFCTDGQLLQMIRKNNRMQQAQVSPIIREICEGLDYIHKEEIIHRDIKPQNILFNFGTVKISDFGWAVYSANGMRKTVSGSPLYYSPQIVLQTSYDQKIDLWAIGMMTYECLLGKIPFRIYSQLDLNRIVQDQIKFPQYVDVSDEAKDFILKIMRKKPEERMQMKEIMRHPFITKYARERKLSPQVMEEIRKTLGL